jgi:hypothetical protein
MHRRSAWICLTLVLGCGDDSPEDSCEAPVRMQECRAGYPQADAPLVESNIELMRSRVGREKGLVPACFMLGAPEYSCDYAEASNETHCETAKHGVFPAQTFTVVWHDQDCGSYSGEVFLESSGAASRRKLVARLTPIEPGRLQAEGVDTDFDWGIPWPPAARHRVVSREPAVESGCRWHHLSGLALCRLQLMHAAKV